MQYTTRSYVFLNNSINFDHIDVIRFDEIWAVPLIPLLYRCNMSLKLRLYYLAVALFYQIYAFLPQQPCTPCCAHSFRCNVMNDSFKNLNGRTHTAARDRKMRLAPLSMARDFYETLGVSRNADTKDIKSAYRKVSLFDCCFEEF